MADEEKTQTEKQDVIIVLEDSIPNRNILVGILTKFGFEVLAGINGIKGLELLEQCQNENKPLVAIISDIMMPEMDGITFLGKVKQMEKIKDIPFLFVTAVADKNYIVESKTLGITNYLLKPITVDQIRDKLIKLFPHKKFPLPIKQKAS